MGRDEILETGETLAEVCHDGRLDDLARGLRHQAAHTGKLTHLLGRATSTGVGHDVDRVEGLLLLGLAVRLGNRDELDLLHHGGGDLFGRTGPDVEDLVVLFARGEGALALLVLDHLHLGLCLADDRPLLARDDHVVERDADAGAGREGVTEGPHPVGEDDSRLLAGDAIGVIDELGEVLLLQGPVDGLEGHAGREDFAEEDAARGRVDPRSVHTDRDLRLQVDVLRVVGCNDLVAIGEEAPLAAGAKALTGHPVAAEDDVLRRGDDRLAVGRRKDVVGREEEDTGLHLRLD